jgi:flagellar assembly factor FliW
MRIQTTRFGEIEVPEEAVLHFPRGLYGLRGTRDYCLLRHDERGLFHWLQAADAPAIAMVLTDPFIHFPDYEVEVPDSVGELLGSLTREDLSIFTSITVDAEARLIYANLLGPIVINPASRRGIQLVQDGTRYTTRHQIATLSPVQAAA